VRNTVGFTWSASGQFFFNMIERDLMGDDRPDDVLFLGGAPGTNYSWYALRLANIKIEYSPPRLIVSQNRSYHPRGFL